MGLRCLVFSPDEGTSASIRQILEDLGIEGESCPEAVTAVQQVTQQSYQVVIVDWDQQPEGGLLLAAARERKASERPLILAMVSHDHNAPKALQAGANSILRKPVVLNQAKDTLTTARDLLRARQESAAAAAVAATAKAQPPVASAIPASVADGERTLRGAEFLPSSVPAPGGQFDTESDVQRSMEKSAAEIDPLKELEPMAAAVKRSHPAPDPPARPAPDEPRGLQWYLNQRAAAAPKMAPQPPAPDASPSAAPEVLGFDQMPTASTEWRRTEESSGEQPASELSPDAVSSAPDAREEKHEAKLFAYIAGEDSESGEKPRRSFRLGKTPIIGALALAACAVAAAPQAPWHAQIRALFRKEQQALHAWLNPQVVTPAQAPESHENFGRAGDEYKLPVAENIPDATTDPSQIRVTPVIDPTAKKSPGVDASADQPAAGPGDTAAANPTEPGTAPGTEPGPGVQVPPSPVESTPANEPGNSGTTTAAANPGASAPSPAVATPAAPPPAVVQMHPDQPASGAPDNSSTQPVPQKRPQVQVVSTPATPPIPSSLRSQIATMAPEASGNKPPEAALPSIEPVNIAEAAARALLAEQPALAYPASAKGLQGTVILEVLIGRDGTVQDAKFLQGSLAFAKAAIDGAKQWKFKPYMLNGRPVSVQTSLTLIFKPTP